VVGRYGSQVHYCEKEQLLRRATRNRNTEERGWPRNFELGGMYPKNTKSHYLMNVCCEYSSFFSMTRTHVLTFITLIVKKIFFRRKCTCLRVNMFSLSVYSKPFWVVAVGYYLFKPCSFSTCTLNRSGWRVAGGGRRVAGGGWRAAGGASCLHTGTCKEWQFLQRVTLGIGVEFFGIENASHGFLKATGVSSRQESWASDTRSNGVGRSKLDGIYGSMWTSPRSAAGKRRISIGDAPINHGGGEGCNPQIKFRTFHRKARD
jgi:hypothetical protein